MTEFKVGNIYTVEEANENLGIDIKYKPDGRVDTWCLCDGNWELVSESSSKFKVGDKVKLFQNHRSLNYPDGIMEKTLTINTVFGPTDFGDKQQAYGVEEDTNDFIVYKCDIKLVSESNQLNTQEDKMGKTKTVYEVLAVNKKTSEIDKDVTVVADSESQAILKAFGVDVENLEFKVTARTTFTEEKAQTVVLEKDKKN